MDIVKPEVRSRMMASIRGRDTKPELMVRQYLHGCGFRYRLHVRELPGRPDLVLPKWKAAVFVHGCFWHGHEGCRYFRVPATRTDFWVAKIRGNAERDARAEAALIGAGWRVIVLWECALRHNREEALLELVNHIQNRSALLRIVSEPSQPRTAE